MKITTTGKSLKELLEIYGTGEAGFYPQDWYKDEAFFTEKPEAGEWEFDFETDLPHLTFKEQEAKLKKDYSAVHPAILCEAILSHYKETRVRVLQNIYSRTSILDSDGYRVSVGRFDAKGLVVVWYDDSRDDGIGLSAVRLINKITEEGTRELPEVIELNGVKYKKV